MNTYKKSFYTFIYIFLLSWVPLHPFASDASIFLDEADQEFTLEDLYERLDVLQALADEVENMELNGDILVLQLEHSPIMAGIVSARRPGRFVAKNVGLESATTPVLRDLELDMQKLQETLRLPDNSFHVHVAFTEDALPTRKRIKALHIDSSRSYISVAPIGITEEIPVSIQARPRQMSPPITHQQKPPGDTPANQAGETPLSAQPSQPNPADAVAQAEQQPRVRPATKPRPPYYIKDGVPARVTFSELVYDTDLPHDVHLNVPHRVGLHLNHFQEIVNRHRTKSIRFDKKEQVKQPKPPRTRWQKIRRIAFWTTLLGGATSYGVYGWSTGDWGLSNLRRVLPDSIPFSLGFSPEEVDYDLAMLYEEIAHYERVIEQRTQSTPLDWDWSL